MSNLQKLRRFINATEKYHMISRNHEYGMHMLEHGAEKSWWINRKPKPHTQYNTQTLKIMGLMKNRRIAASNKRAMNAMNAMIQAYRNLVPIYGIGMNARMAARLVTMAEIRAGRTIAKALNSNAVLKRAQNRRRARNFIGAELSMYRPRSGSLVRPSNVKARRIRSPWNV
jgi:hypothetical protein